MAQILTIHFQNQIFKKILKIQFAPKLTFLPLNTDHKKYFHSLALGKIEMDIFGTLKLVKIKICDFENLLMIVIY